MTVLTDRVCVREGYSYWLSHLTHSQFSVYHHEIKEGQQETRMRWYVWVIMFMSLTLGKWGKGRGCLWRLLWHFMQACWISVFLPMYVCAVCLCETIASCVHTAVGETSCIGLGNTVGGSVPFWLCWVYICECVCMHECWQDLVLVSPSCHHLITLGLTWILISDTQPAKG